MKQPKKPIRNARGFSLIELMVGVLIALLGMVVIGQVFSVTEATKRSTIGGGDAVQNGSLALYLLNKDLNQAGHGFNDPTVMGCVTQAFFEPTSTPYSYLFTPVTIVQGTGGSPDTITTLYSTSTRASTQTVLVGAVTTATQAYKVESNYGYNPGDLIVIAEVKGSNPAPTKFCIQSQVTAVTTTVLGPSSKADFFIEHTSGASYTDIYGNTQVSQYNRGGGIALPVTPSVGYGATGAAQARIFNLSNNVVAMNYSVANNTLLATAAGSGTNAVVANGIVDMQAQYGVDNNPTNSQDVVDVFQDTAPANMAAVMAVRYGFVARIGNREQDCTITTAAPTWAGGTFTFVTTLPDWQCYRYRVFEGTTVLRNQMWRVRPAI